MKSVPAPLWPTETDPEHIVARGFDVTLSSTELTVIDEDASVPPPVVLRSAWGRALRTPREHWSYDFVPLLYSGTQMWTHRTLPVPPLLASTLPSSCLGPGRGAYVSLEEVAPSYDTLEFVFQPDTWPGSFPDEVCMAWVVLDTPIPGIDPFVVAAVRVLEPLISELRNALQEADADRVAHLRDLRREIDALSAAVRDLQAQPGPMRRAVKAALSGIATVLLGIVATRLNPVIDRIDWPAFYNAVLEVIRQLNLN